jgi:hypothetical protein
MKSATAAICPVCGAVQDQHESVDGNAHDMPREGDSTICVRCMSVSIYCADGTRRLPTLAELEDVRADVRYQKVIARLRFYHMLKLRQRSVN